jgi:ribosome maturation factor RimP
MNQYHLEVSSPGLNRPLRKPEHFQKHLGRIVDVRATTPINSRRRFKGRLIHAGPEGITVDCEGHVFEIPLNLLERARLSYFESLDGENASQTGCFHVPGGSVNRRGDREL